MVAKGADGRAMGDGLKSYYRAKIEELEILCRDKQHNLRRLEAQRNELNTKGQYRRTLPLPPSLYLLIILAHAGSEFAMINK